MKVWKHYCVYGFIIFSILKISLSTVTFILKKKKWCAGINKYAL